VTIGSDRLAGAPDGSSDGATMCAAMISSVPAAIAARNGGRSLRSKSARVSSVTAMPLSVLILVLPRPGKCLAVAATCADW